MLEKIQETCNFVKENSEYVKINEVVIDKFAESFRKPSFWLENNPYQILDWNIEEIINFLLVFHTIGDYCFWGMPKWEIDTPSGVMDGSFAIMYKIVERFQKEKDFEMSYEEFQTWLKGNVEIPLLKERYEELLEMNEKMKGKSFYKQIESIKDAENLVEYLVQNFSYYKDTRNYKGKEIWIYKRAQLLASDILHVRKLKENIEVNYNGIIGCADYKIPQVMHCLGMLEYESELEEKIMNLEEIEENSAYEVEIRANTLMVIDYLSAKLKIPRMDINDYIWLLGQDKSKINKPYHRTKTTNY